MSDTFIHRYANLEIFLAQKGIDAILIAHPPNIRYLSNFSGGEGILVVLPPERILFVDPRYTLRAQEECRGVSVIEVLDTLEGATSFLKSKECRYVGLETSHITVDTFHRIKRSLKGLHVRSLKNSLDHLRMVKDLEEIKSIEKAIDIHTHALDETLAWLYPGVTERDWAIEFEYRVKLYGAEALSFETIVASGYRSAIPHATSSPVPLPPNSPVVFDHGVIAEGYCSDETATFFTTPPSHELREIYQVVREAHDQAIEAVRPGIAASAIDGVARGWIENAGYGKHFTHGTGHGVGLEIHEFPFISSKDKTILRSGMVFTIEPGIYLNGKAGIRIEDMVLVTDTGCRLLTKRSKSLTVLFE